MHGGKSIDTSMGFTPAAGLVDEHALRRPGSRRWSSFLAHTEQMTAQQFHHMVNHESGLLGVSEISSDMRDLLAREADDVAAAEAVALFCYQAKKWVGAFAAALGGLDTLVFSGGHWRERSASIRARICEGLGFLGIELDDARNAAHARGDLDRYQPGHGARHSYGRRTDDCPLGLPGARPGRGTQRNVSRMNAQSQPLPGRCFARWMPIGGPRIICRSGRSTSMTIRC